MADINDPSNCTELVLFDPDPPAFSSIKQTILSETSAFFKEEAPYVGLSNQGATCYMNSLLQTLFMNPDFRKGLYDWQYDSKKHSKEADCIPFQLQKLFAKLQMKFNHYIDTKELTKSFQWNAGESFEQQDIQEFCRVLFDAIEQSCRNSKAENLIQDLYEGSSINYVKCMECLYESQRQESFLDVCLTVKNKIDKIYNDSLEKALQTYLKPETLQGSNQYFCEKCDKKVDAHRGTRFHKLPKCLCLILNRFSFDYFLFKRIKLEDFVSFPFVLNFNNFINGYENIKNKLSEEMNPSYFESEQPIPKTSVKKPVSFKQPMAKVTNVKRPSKTSKPSSQTSSFLKEMRAKNKASSGGSSSKDIEISINDSNKGSHDSGSHPNENGSHHTSELNSAIGTAEAKDKKPANPKKRQVAFDLEEECIQNELEIEPNEQNVIIEVEQEPLNNEEKKEEANGSVGKLGPELDRMDPAQQAELNLKAEKEAFEAMKALRAEHMNRNAKEIHELKEKYLQEGPLVYELYSILTHSGGAYGGHYFNYTKSFEDGRWYLFDDTSVKEIDVDDIGGRVFGGANRSATAYMLMYRQVDKGQSEQQKLEIPEYIKEILKVEKQELQRQYEEKCELLKQLTVKVYYKLEVKLIPIKTTDTYSYLLEESLKAYNLQSEAKNARLRVYSSHTDTMSETFHGKEEETLENLKIGNFKTLALEIKKDDEVFQEFDENKTCLRVVIWTPEVPRLESLNALQPEVKKIDLMKYSTLRQVHELVGQLYSIPWENLLLYKKVVTSGLSIAHLLTNPEKMDYNLLELVLIENTLIYVETKPEGSNEDNHPKTQNKWQEEFDKEANRFTIRHNNPAIEFVNKDSNQDNDECQYTVVIDARQTLRELKEKICGNLGLNPDELIMKRVGKMGVEIKDLNGIISSQHFVNGSSVYIEFGKPSIPGQFRVLFSFARPTDLMNDNFFYVFEDFMEIPIPGEYIASKVKDVVLAKLKERKGIELNPDLVRLRERNSERLTRIYRDMPMITQQIFERRMMAIEEIKEKETLGFKDIVVIVRIWNSQTMELSERFEVTVNKDKPLKELTEMIYSKNQTIEPTNMIGCRILSISRFNACSLMSEEWFGMHTEEVTCSEHPFYLNNDGYLMIIKDVNIPFKEMTEEEMKKYGVAVNNRGKFKVDYSALNKKNVVEKALKIHIKGKEEEREEENHKEENNEGGQ